MSQNRVSQSKQAEIRNHCLKHSRASPNRTLKKTLTDGQPTTVRFLTCSKSQLYREFVKENPNTDIGASVFNKYTPTEYKPARRDQDKCGTCFECKKLVKRLIDYVLNYYIAVAC